MTSSDQKPRLISLGRSIQSLRAEQGLDSKQLAKKAGLRHRRLTTIEEGRTDPDYESLVKLADALGVGVATLVERAKTIEEKEADHA